jgi:hypothetical protein
VRSTHQNRFDINDHFPNNHIWQPILTIFCAALNAHPTGLLCIHINLYLSKICQPVVEPPAALHAPIVNFQILNSFKMALIMRDKRHIIGDGRAGDQHVDIIYRLTRFS